LSQRLLVCRADHANMDGYDAVLTERLSEAEARAVLVADWLFGHGRVYFGPWKITVEDVAVYRQHERMIAAVLESRRHAYPDAVWVFYAPGRPRLEHPTREALEAWLG
jgi:hypothetical protein